MEEKCVIEKVYVRNSTGLLKKVLLCPPVHIGIEPIDYISKKWAAKGEKSNRQACLKEHAELVQAYRESGVEVVLADPVKGLVNQVYARDFGACLANGYILGRFREPVRQGETAFYVKEMERLEIPCIARCTEGYFEGGDFCFLDESTLAVGLVQRTDWRGLRNIARQVRHWGYTVVPVICPRDNLHLDMCFNIAAEGVAVICREALPADFVKMLEQCGFELIEVSQGEVFLHACNIQALGGGKVLSFSNNKKVNRNLQALGLEVLAVDLSEILKSGGGPHCMTFPLERA
ncbi:amidinotransferase [Lucifera butyrica]|uniref:Amidinotransferase n=1 Tax=Lucifera butyrica TaxID=1351585 RepID=A0A498REA6_9FIRM|nr:dimethylarginine dimethylaminohydrolase family protein [Lucifera butyrica]VBB09821.1 amidinotransferase [Lucifera butyrica]